MRRRGQSIDRKETLGAKGDLKADEQEDDKERRAHVVEAIETVQVIAALLAGTGIAFLDDLKIGEESTYLEQELIRFLVIAFVGLNMYGLIVLSNQLFYLRQCLAKDLR